MQVSITHPCEKDSLLAHPGGQELETAPHVLFVGTPNDFRWESPPRHVGITLQFLHPWFQIYYYYIIQQTSRC